MTNFITVSGLHANYIIKQYVDGFITGVLIALTIILIIILIVGDEQ